MKTEKQKLVFRDIHSYYTVLASHGKQGYLLITPLRDLSCFKPTERAK